MTVDRGEVRRIAALARLHLPEEETGRVTEEMNRILEYVDRLRAADEHGGREGAPGDRAGASPAAHDTPEGSAGEIGGAGSPRPDESDPLQRGVDAFAPRFEDGFFVVPPLPGVTPDEQAG